MVVVFAALKKSGVLKGSWREAEVWYQVAGLESLKRVEKSLGRDAASVTGEIPAYPRYQDGEVHQRQLQVWSGVFLACETSCVCFLWVFFVVQLDV